MDFPKPERLPRNYYQINFHKESKVDFMNQVAAKCQDKEDVTACVEKYEKAFDSVFEHLKTKLEEEQRVAFYFDKRNYTGDGNAYLRKNNFPTGYENWS